MNNTNTGGPAFPMNWVKQEAPNLNVILEQRGMTLRDYFAAKAMQAMLSSPELMVVVTADQVLGDNAKQRISNLSYQYANAMLKAREA